MSKGVKLIAFGYKYNSSSILCFVVTKSAGSTSAGNPYRACFLDVHDNLVSRLVEVPELISKYFQWSNRIDKHNQAWQFKLCLEKHCKTQNAWLNLVASVIGICITDAWTGYRYAFHGKCVRDLCINLLMSLYTTTCSQIRASIQLRFYRLCYIALKGDHQDLLGRKT
jgi:hypothetical protein